MTSIWRYKTKVGITCYVGDGLYKYILHLSESRSTGFLFDNCLFHKLQKVYKNNDHLLLEGQVLCSC